MGWTRWVSAKRQSEKRRDIFFKQELTVDGIPPDQFLTSFEWDGAKNPTHRPIKKIVQELRENVATIDEELKVKTSEYAAAKAQLSGISRKTGGSLATRDLEDTVQESDVSLFVAPRPQTHTYNAHIFSFDAG